MRLTKAFEGFFVDGNIGKLLGYFDSAICGSGVKEEDLLKLCEGAEDLLDCFFAIFDDDGNADHGGECSRKKKTPPPFEGGGVISRVRKRL